jgi:acyl-CoA thioesterase
VLPTTARDLQLNLDGSWGIGGKIHGGYLLSEIVRAALDRLPESHPHPLAVSAQFLSAPDAGPADLTVEVLRTGRSVSSLRARLGQDGQIRTEVLLTAGTLRAGGEPVWVAPNGVPDLPPPDTCPRAPSLRVDGIRIGHLDHVDLRLDPRVAGFAQGRPGRTGELRGWLRPDGEHDPTDPVWLLIAGDALPPLTFNFGLLGWVPTVSFDMHLRALPPTGWLKAVQRAQLIADNWLDETCDLYDESGRLVGSARQLAGYRG